MAKANEAALRARVRTVLRSSYSNYYRRMLPHLLGALEFRCNNTAYRPVMEAVELLARYTGRRAETYDVAEPVPIDGVVPREWRGAAYELCVLSALRDAIRRREIWVAGAGRWRDPDADLPPDFDLNRDMHYAAIRQPTDAIAFLDQLRARLDGGLARLAEAIRIGHAGGVRVGTRRNEVWISVPRPVAQPEPVTLEALKAEVTRRWGVVGLLDVLKEADWLTDFHVEFPSVAGRENLPRDVLRRRLLLVLLGLGTNVGIRRVVTLRGPRRERGRAAPGAAHVRHPRQYAPGHRAGGGRDPGRPHPRWWGDGTACASDSKKFGPGRRI